MEDFYSSSASCLLAVQTNLVRLVMRLTTGTHSPEKAKRQLNRYVREGVQYNTPHFSPSERLSSASVDRQEQEEEHFKAG